MEVNFILVEPKVPENIGASARAINTMGFTSLSLVNPCSDTEGRANWLAHGSQDILDSAKIFNTLDEAVVDMDLVIGTTARDRWLQKDIVDTGDLKSFLSDRFNNIKRVAIVFGREESGLTTAEMKLCDIASSIQMAKKYPSLNLSQAVMIYAYELSGKIDNKSDNTIIEPGNSIDSLKVLRSKVESILDLSGISDNKMLSGRILERLPHADNKDLNLIHSIASAILTIIDKDNS